MVRILFNRDGRNDQDNCDEFSFRWGSRKVADGSRATEAIKGMAGKHLSYRDLAGRK
jgi:hypothetical protein